MSCFKCFSIVVAVIAIVLYALYIPLPSCYDDMPLDLRTVIHVVPHFHSLGALAEKLGIATQFQVLRMFLRPPREPDTDAIKSIDEDFDGIPVRLYMPTHRVPHGPALFYVHGGGFVVGNPNMMDKMVYSFAEQLNMLTVSVDYRLAPESPYPAAIDDVERAFRHFAKHAADYNIDPSRIAAAGDSAGGDLVASLTIRLKKAAAKADAEGELHPQIKVQFLLYPVLQGVNFTSVSMLRNIDDFFMPRLNMMQYVLAYALGMDYYNLTLRNAALRYLDQGCYRLKYPDAEDVFTNNNKHEDIRERIITDEDRAFLASLQQDTEKRKLLNPVCNVQDLPLLNELHTRLAHLSEPDFSPLLNPSMQNLPPAFVISCGFDVLRDEAFLYVERLRDAGVFVEHRYEPTQCHGYIGFVPHKTAKEMNDFITKNALL